MVLPVISTVACPPVWERNSVGNRTSTGTGPPGLWARGGSLTVNVDLPPRDSTGVAGALDSGSAGLGGVGQHDHGFLGDFAAGDGIAANHRMGVSQGDQDVVPA